MLSNISAPNQTWERKLLFNFIDTFSDHPPAASGHCQEQQRSLDFQAAAAAAAAAADAAAAAAADAAASLQCLGVAGQLRGSTLTFERLESSAGRQNRRAAQAALIS